ncbi:MAG: hypothetical protein ACFFAY_13185, partial [Promethearchaeota archaeon]
KEQGLQHLYARTLLIRSDVLAVAGQNLEAKGHLESAVSIATFVEDSKLLDEASKKLEVIMSPKNVRAMFEEPSFTKSFDIVSGFKPAGKFKQVPKPTLQAILVMDRASGLTEFVHHFENLPAMDSTIVSGFLSAISAFTGELLGESGLLRSINHEGSTIMLEHTSSRIVAMIVEKETFDIRYALHEFARRFNEAYPTIEGRNGIDTSEYPGAESLVAEIFFSDPSVEAG